MKKKAEAKAAAGKMPVHPAAAVFPMLGEDELNELAADIAANGQRETIKTKDGQLIDGRNRLAACEIAGVEAAFEELAAGIDAETYILSVNINRRHLNKGQRAMAVAMIHPEKRQGKKRTSELNSEVSGKYLQMARTVLEVLPELANDVMNGKEPLNAAFETAKGQRLVKQVRDEALAKLRTEFPDLAEAVAEERMTPTQAVDEADKRVEDADESRRISFILFDRVISDVEYISDKNVERMAAFIRTFPNECKLSISEIKANADRIIEGWQKLKDSI